MLRFIVWPGESTTYVWDFRDGLVETEFTVADFVIPQCKEATAKSLFAKILKQQ